TQNLVGGIHHEPISCYGFGLCTECFHLVLPDVRGVQKRGRILPTARGLFKGLFGFSRPRADGPWRETHGTAFPAGGCGCVRTRRLGGCLRRWPPTPPRRTGSASPRGHRIHRPY